MSSSAPSSEAAWQPNGQPMSSSAPSSEAAWQPNGQPMSSSAPSSEAVRPSAAPPLVTQELQAGALRYEALQSQSGRLERYVPTETEGNRALPRMRTSLYTQEEGPFHGTRPSAGPRERLYEEHQINKPPKKIHAPFTAGFSRNIVHAIRATERMVNCDTWRNVSGSSDYAKPLKQNGTQANSWKEAAISFNVNFGKCVFLSDHHPPGAAPDAVGMNHMASPDFKHPGPTGYHRVFLFPGCRDCNNTTYDDIPGGISGRYLKRGSWVLEQKTFYAKP